MAYQQPTHMPFVTEIRCPTNGLLFASFYVWDAYRYRLDKGVEFPLGVTYGWCHNCERFVECERLWSVDEIKHRIDELLATKDDWDKHDARAVEILARQGRELPGNLKQAALHRAWVAALLWRQARNTPPRCLECGSFFAIEVLPDSGAVLRPAGIVAVENAPGEVTVYG